MPSAMLVVFAHPESSDSEIEFNRWYDEEHMPDVLRIPGMKAANRFRLSPARGADPTGTAAPYLALYEIDSPDPGECLRELRRRAGTDSMPLSPAMAQWGERAPRVMLYEALK